MIKRSASSTLTQSVFPMEDDGSVLGGYTFFVSVIQKHKSIYLESFLKWEIRDSEVERYKYIGDISKLIEWTVELDAFATESAQFYIRLIKKMKDDSEDKYGEEYILTAKDLPELAGVRQS